MKKKIVVFLLLISTYLSAQHLGSFQDWNTWFIPSSNDFSLPKPENPKNEIKEVLNMQKNIAHQEMMRWNAGSPSYHWQNLMASLWTNGTNEGILANLLLGISTYDATLTAWKIKNQYKRKRPFEVNIKVKTFGPKPTSPSYPCEYAVAAGTAVTIISHFFPEMADSVQRMAQQQMDSRIMSGFAFPSDTKAGFDLGKRIAQAEIEKTKGFLPKQAWDGKVPSDPKLWRGPYAAFPQGGQFTTVVLTNGSQFRPLPPPDFEDEMQELRNFVPSQESQANAFYWNTQNFWLPELNKRMFEYNFHLDPVLSARIYAIASLGSYEGFVSCFDAKYAYWGIRPDQYDPTYKPLLPTPPFPGYPSGHAAISSVMGELYSYLFPLHKDFFLQKAKDAAESRFQGGIHFRSDNEVGLQLGRKVAGAIIESLDKEVILFK